jgi:hypothetical protein
MKNNKLIKKLISELEKAPLSSGNFEIGVIVGKIISENTKNDRKENFLEGLQAHI